MPKSYDGLQPQEDPLTDNEQDDNFIIEYNGSDSNSKSFKEDPVEYTEEIYLDIDSSDHVEDAVELSDHDNSIASTELEDLFHCSTCNVDFHSVEKHIKQFHGGHEVLLDVGNVIKISLYRTNCSAKHHYFLRVSKNITSKILLLLRWSLIIVKT